MPEGATLSVTETWTDSLGQPHPITVTETAADLAAHWSTTSFALFTDNDFTGPLAGGPNGTGRGASNMGPDPNLIGNIVAGYDIALVQQYFNGATGNGEAAMEFLALHEVAHDSFAGGIMDSKTPGKNYDEFSEGTTNHANENFASTVALVTMEALGLNLGKYDPTTGTLSPTGDWQTADLWTVNYE
jgi:hypothetical protein